MPDSKVFLSYRRKSSNYAARAIFQYLEGEGYDVFMDVESLDSGKFPPLILRQIKARTHFLVVLAPTSLKRTAKRGDWLRREIEYAMEQKRNVVPVFVNGFSFEDEEKGRPGKKLPGKLSKLKEFQGVDVPDNYFAAAMEKLTDRFLKKDVQVSITPTPAKERPVVQQMIKKVGLVQVDPLGTNWVAPSFKLPKGTPLLAPTLKAPTGELLGRTWKWNSVFGATSYVLEKSTDAKFSSPTELYSGDKTEFIERGSFPSEFSPASVFGIQPHKPAFSIQPIGAPVWYYRVRAKGGLLFLDSPWSNVVKAKPPGKIPLRAPTLNAPTDELLGRSWKWTSVLVAESYILEKSTDAKFSNPTELYSGDKTEFIERGSFPSAFSPASVFGIQSQKKPVFPIQPHKPAFSIQPLVAPVAYYRVRAKGRFLFLDSPWSNVVEAKLLSG